MVVDASVWVSRFISTEVHHEASRRWRWRMLANARELILPALGLAEVGGAVARRTGSTTEGENAVEELLARPFLRVVALDNALGAEAGRLAARARLRGADAVYAAVARTLGLALVTWDDEMIARAGGLVEVSRPDGG